VFNGGASECGVSNYDCDALCAESERIGEDSGCSAETTAFWACFAAAPRGAFCTAGGLFGRRLPDVPRRDRRIHRVLGRGVRRDAERCPVTP